MMKKSWTPITSSVPMGPLLHESVRSIVSEDKLVSKTNYLVNDLTALCSILQTLSAMGL